MSAKHNVGLGAGDSLVLLYTSIFWTYEQIVLLFTATYKRTCVSLTGIVCGSCHEVEMDGLGWNAFEL